MKRKAPAQRSDTIWTDADTHRLREGLQHLSVLLDEAAFGKVVQWARLLKQWNRTYNLLGNSDSTHLIDEHLLDSLAIVPVLERYLPRVDEALVDVGTGAGFPGILLAIAQPQRPVYLVEPVGKKVAFLRQSVLTLGLKNALVLSGKVEDLESLLHEASAKGRRGNVSLTAPHGNLGARLPDAAAGTAKDTAADAPHTGTAAAAPDKARQPVDDPAPEGRLPHPPHFICRAFTALGRFASLCEPYMSKDSLLFAMKSLRLSEEQQELPANIMLQAVEPLPTIDLGIQRNLAILALAANARAARDTQPSGTLSPTPCSDDPEAGVAQSTAAAPSPAKHTPTTAPSSTAAPDPTAASNPTAAPDPTAAPNPTAAPDPTAVPDPTMAPDPLATGPLPSTSLPPSAQPNRRRPQ